MKENALKTLSPAQFAFLKWLSDTHPNLMAQAEQHRSSLSGFMDSLTKTFDSVMTKAPDLMNQYVTSKAQLEQLKLNIERAKRGEPPITEGFTGQVQQVVSTVPGWVWAGGAAILVYLLMKK